MIYFSYLVDQWRDMSKKQDIERVERVETDLTTIEGYVKGGIWNPDKNKESAEKLVSIDIALNQLQGDILPEEQVEHVSRLIKRFEELKFKLPPPPWAL